MGSYGISYGTSNINERINNTLNITSDNISITHNFVFARPIPTDHFNCLLGNPPIYTDSGIFSKE